MSHAKKELPGFQTLTGNGLLILRLHHPSLAGIMKHMGKFAKKEFTVAVSKTQNLRKVEENLNKLMEISLSPTEFPPNLSLDLRYKEKVHQCDGGKTDDWQSRKF